MIVLFSQQSYAMLLIIFYLLGYATLRINKRGVYYERVYDLQRGLPSTWY